MKRRLLFPILILGLMLIVAACGLLSGENNRDVVTATSPLPTQSTATVTPSPTPTTPVPTLGRIITPTPEPVNRLVQLPRCEGAPPPRLIVQERGRVTDNGERLNLRSGPGTNYERLIIMQPNALFMVLDGPTCNETYAWYRVRYRDVVGWLAEGDLNEYYTEPYLPG